MAIKIETFKTLLLEQLTDDFAVNLPYTREHRPEQYSSLLIEAQCKVQALIKLENMIQCQVDRLIESNAMPKTGGLPLAVIFHQIAAFNNDRQG